MKNCVKDIYWYCVNEQNIINKQYSNYTFNNEQGYNEIIKNMIFFNDILMDDRFVTLQPLINRVFTRMRQIISDLSIEQINITWFNRAEYVELKTLIANMSEFETKDVAILNSQILLMDRPLLNHDNGYTNFVIPYNKYEKSFQPGLHAYSFALNPNDTTKPSGSLNMSMMENVVLKLHINKDVLIENEYINIKVIGRSYNILRVMSGMAACVY
jgi:hypothetical protein